MDKVLSLGTPDVTARRLGRLLLLSSTALTAATLAVTLSATGAGAQQVVAGAGQTIEIPSETYPNPINGVKADGAGAQIIGTDAEITKTAINGNVAAAWNGGSLDLTGGSVTGSVVNTNLAQEIQTVGALGGTVTLSGVLIETTGSNVVTGPPYSISTGVDANYGGIAILEDVVIHSQGYRTHGIIANINGGTVTATNTSIVLEGPTSTGVQSYEAASSITLNGGSVTTNGDSSVGLTAQRGGYLWSSADVLINGQNSVGAATDRGGTMELSGASITTTAYGSVGLWADGEGSSIVGDDVAVHTEIRAGYGAVASNGGAIDLTGGSITVDAGTADAGAYPPGFTYGLYAIGEGSSITTDGTAISTAEIWSFAVYATDGATIDVAGGSITTTGERGYGLLSEDGSSVTSSATIVTGGFKAHGAQAYKNTDVDPGGEITLTGGSITTNGNEAYGIFATKAGSTITGSIDVTTNGMSSHGVVTDRGGVIELADSDITTTAYGSIGLWADGEGSSIAGDNLTVHTEIRAGYGAMASNGGAIDLTGGSITVDAGTAIPTPIRRASPMASTPWGRAAASPPTGRRSRRPRSGPSRSTPPTARPST